MRKNAPSDNAVWGGRQARVITTRRHKNNETPTAWVPSLRRPVQVFAAARPIANAAPAGHAGGLCRRRSRPARRLAPSPFEVSVHPIGQPLDRIVNQIDRLRQSALGGEFLRRIKLVVGQRLDITISEAAMQAAHSLMFPSRSGALNVTER